MDLNSGTCTHEFRMTQEESSPDTIDSSNLTSRESRISARHLMIGLVLGLGLGAAGLLAILAIMAPDAAPLVTEASLSAAVRKWESHGPASYNLDLKLGGTQQGEIHIEVRDGRVTKMTRGGRTPSQRRTWEYWTVPSQFETIRQDLELAKSPERPFGVSSPSQVVLRAKFDPELGYPVFYQRHVMGARYDIEWRYIRFEPAH